MSYEPTIIVFKPDLDNKKDEIEQWAYKKRPAILSEVFLKKQKAYSVLQHVITMETFKIQNVEMVLFTPGGTQHNAAVRKLLYDLNIQFSVTH